jgi:uncharacterized membrane protein affecting hemolysin expression
VKAWLIIALVVVAIVGGLLTLRRRTRMPDADVLERAQRRAREQDAAEKRRDD